MNIDRGEWTSVPGRRYWCLGGDTGAWEEILVPGRRYCHMLPYYYIDRGHWDVRNNNSLSSILRFAIYRHCLGRQPSGCQS